VDQLTGVSLATQQKVVGNLLKGKQWFCGGCFDFLGK
jgi:hypothetical protein